MTDYLVTRTVGSDPLGAFNFQETELNTDALLAATVITFKKWLHVLAPQITV